MMLKNKVAVVTGISLKIEKPSPVINREVQQYNQRSERQRNN